MPESQSPQQPTETYRNGIVRPDCMKNLPDWALREFLGRHFGPALDAARDEAIERGWTL